ncbi:hypothetical protein [Flavivirga eckloniae]|uniref:DUF4252 domain-containing protein n=1 Tax=Flavivirga eckloniae TaxID=1803846 RepID=A0A2K9PT65_9FLAO|nr:hypothetical protein [Flavivirga eckloniae]AUP80254.1 hypothetical protein C1H87_16695 [Flavivirga eckloniae]
MKRTLLIFLLLPFLSFCQTENKSFTFQGLNWGDTETKVKSTIEDLETASNGLTKTTVINNLNAELLLQVNNDALERISYTFTEQHGNENVYIEDLKKVKDLLTKRYGTPAVDELKWNNDLLKNDESRYGMAVSSGHLEYIATWSLPDTYIILNLASDQSKITHTLVYKSIKN